MSESEDLSKSKARVSRTRRSSQSEGETGDEDASKHITQASEMQVGMKLEAMDKYGKWYAAKVLELDESSNEILVHFERWSSRYDESVPINSGRLRPLSLARQEELEKEKEKAKKDFKPGDRIQAKWIDGRMYFGKVIRVLDTDVDLLFDDGVEYTAPITAVKKRVYDKSNIGETSKSIAESRRQRAEKRMRAEKRKNSEDTSSQSSPSSPSPVPAKKSRSFYFDSDSTGTESDFDDPHRNQPEESHDQHDKLCLPSTKTVEMGLTVTPVKKCNDIEKLRLIPPFSKLSPVKEVIEVTGAMPKQAKSNLMSPVEGSVVKKAPELSPLINTQVAVSAPPDTPLTTAVHKSGLSTRPRRSITYTSDSSKDTVSTRTRAQTKVENVPKSKKGGKMGAPKELVISWDHNEFKCKVSDCNKSFRKDSLLQSHVKHYHSPPPAPKPKTTPRAKANNHLNSSPEERNRDSSPLLNSKPHPSESKQSPGVREDKKEVKENTESPAKEGGEKEDRSKNYGEDHHSSTTTKHKKQQKAQLSKKNITLASGGGVLSVAKAPSRVPILEVKAISHDLVNTPQLSRTQETLSISIKTDQSEKNKVDQPENIKTPRHRSTSQSSSSNEHQNDDVVRCKCGSDVDEGFMIQCEQCLCWQHGDCIGIRSGSLPKKYICCICSNPPGQRSRLKHKYSDIWYGGGMLPSVSGGPPFPTSQNKPVLISHEVTSSLYKVKKMIHSSEVKLQAASNPHHPYLKQWAKECSHFDEDAVMSYLIDQLLPVSYQPGSDQPNSEEKMEELQDEPLGNHSNEEAESDCHAGETEVEDKIEIENSVKSEDEETKNVENKDQESMDQDGNETKTEDSEDSTDRTKIECETDDKTRTTTKRKLRSSTIIQKNAVYYVPKRHKKNNALPSPLSDNEGKEGGDKEPLAGDEEETLKLAPLPPLSKEDFNTLTSVTTEVLKNSLPQTTTAVSRNQSIPVTDLVPVPASHSHGGSATTSIPPSITVQQTETMMEIMNEDEFGVSEVPVFAMEADNAEQKPCLPQPSSSAAPLTISTSLSSTSLTSLVPCSGFSPSAQSAFKPIASKSNLLNNNVSTGISGITSLKPEPPQSKSVPDSGSHLPLQELSSKSKGMEAVTLGEFAHAFMQGDMTNWFRRMKLLDHIEAVQDNVQAWLEMVEKKLEDIPAETDRLDNDEKFISEVHCTVQKLRECQSSAYNVISN